MRRPRQTVDLVLERRKLEEQAEEVGTIMDRAERAQAPFAADFWTAHEDLLAMSRNRPNYTKESMFAAYDCRMHASRAWYPSKTRFREAARWYNAIVKELKVINEMIAKGSSSPSRKPTGGFSQASLF